MRSLRLVKYLPEKAAAWCLLCLVAVAFAHLSFIPNGFVWLDHGDLEQGRALIPLSRWYSAFTASFADTAFYRPLVTVLHAVDAFLWGIHATGFHCTNIALHCGAAIAAPFFIASYIPLSVRRRCFIAAVFGLHPLAVLPAACISYQSESLLALFTFLAVTLYSKVRARPTWPHGILLLCITACACFSKETAFFYLPSLLLLWEIVRGFGRSSASHEKQGTAHSFLIAVGTVAVALGSALALRLVVMPMQWCITPVHMPPLESVGTRVVVIGKHLLNLISPLPPALSDVVAKCSITQPLALGTAGAIGAIFFAMVRAGIRSGAAVMVALVVVLLFPALNLMPLPRFYSPHYAYCAVAPFAACVMFLYRRLSGIGKPMAGGIRFLIFLWVLVMGVGTMSAGYRFQSDQTLFTPEVRRDPRFSEGWFYLGNFYRRTGNLDAADSTYNQGLAPAPGCIRFFDPMEFLINKSAIAVQRGKYAAADSLMQIAQADAADALQPNIAFIRADIAARRGDFAAVIALLSNEQYNARNAEARRLLDWALSARGRP